MYTNDYTIKRAVDRYYDDGNKDFMPLLLLCLVCRKFIGIRSYVKEENNTLFTTAHVSPCKMTRAFHLKEGISTVEIYYDIPPIEIDKWRDIIDFILHDFKENENQQRDNINFFHELSGQTYPKETDYSSLFEYLTNIWECAEDPNIPYNFIEVFNYIQRGILSLNFGNIYPPQFIPLDESLEVLQTEARMLHPVGKGCIFNPLGGSVLLRHFYPLRTIYGNTHSTALLHLAHLYELTTNDQKEETKWNLFSNKDVSTNKYDYILVNPAIDGFDKNDQYFPSIENLLNEKYLNLLSDQGRMVCTIHHPDKYKSIHEDFVHKITDNDWIEEIFNFHNQIILLSITKNMKFYNRIQLTYVDYHPSYTSGLHNWLKNNQPMETDISNEDIIKEDYYLTSSISFIKKKYIKNVPGFKMVRLGLLLKPLKARTYCSNPPKYSLNGYISGKYQKSYYPFNPYLTAHDGSKETGTRNDFCLEEEALIVGHKCIETGKGKCLLPFLFNPEEGNVCFTGSAFAIDTTKVDPEYLILEMNKGYFRNQVSFSKIYDLNAKDCTDFDEVFLRFDVCIPDNETSLQRQEILAKEAREISFQKMGSNLGIDFSSFYQTDDSALAPKTALKHCEYEIVGTLGRGGFGYTYLAKREQNGKTKYVAIKEFFALQYQKRNKGTNKVISNYEKDVETLALARKKFFNEALKIKKLTNCKHVIKVFDVFDENNTSYYVMEYIKSGDVNKLIKKCHGKGLEESTAIRIIREVAEALKAMHDIKMNHLDVKPSNILIDNDGHARLIDFGTVRDFSEGNKTTTLNVASQDFSAPEVRDGSLKTFSPQADIYSLGKTLKYMLQGEEAPADQSVIFMEAPAENHPSGLDELITQCTSFSSEDRPKDIDEFLSLLDRC